MGDIQVAFALAAELIFSGDADLFEIIGLSLSVSVAAVGLACALGMTLGATIAVTRFPGRPAFIVLLNAFKLRNNDRERSGEQLSNAFNTAEIIQ